MSEDSDDILKQIELAYRFLEVFELMYEEDEQRWQALKQSPGVGVWMKWKPGTVAQRVKSVRRGRRAVESA